MTFSMRQRFALIFVIGPAFGFALSYGRLGIWLSVFYVAITVCLLFLVHRTLKTWRTENVPRRVYGITLSTLCFGLWLLLLANIGANPTIHRTRVAANLQSTLRLDDRFGSVHVEYIEAQTQILKGHRNTQNRRGFRFASKEDFRLRLVEYGRCMVASDNPVNPSRLGRMGQRSQAPLTLGSIACTRVDCPALLAWSIALRARRDANRYT